MKTVLHARISVTEYTSCVSNEENTSIKNQIEIKVDKEEKSSIKMLNS